MRTALIAELLRLAAAPRPISLHAGDEMSVMPPTPIGCC